MNLQKTIFDFERNTRGKKWRTALGTVIRKLWPDFYLAHYFPINHPRIRKMIFKKLKPLRKGYEKLFTMTLADWLIYHQKNIHFNKCRWMGVRALKNPLDAWIYQEIIYDVKPDVIIEIGSNEGGSTLYLAHLLDLIGKGIVISIDTDRTNYKISHKRIVAITGNSSSPETLTRVAEVCQEKHTLVIHDGEHSKNQVLQDLYDYSRFVTLNSYFIVEDGITDLFQPGNVLGDFDDGPLTAVEEFLKENTHFTIDSEREHYILTYNPRGYLKRINKNKKIL